MRIHVPDAQEAGRPITGKVMVKFQPIALSQVQLLSDRLHPSLSGQQSRRP